MRPIGYSRFDGSFWAWKIMALNDTAVFRSVKNIGVEWCTHFPVCLGNFLCRRPRWWPIHSAELTAARFLVRVSFFSEITDLSEEFVPQEDAHKTTRLKSCSQQDLPDFGSVPTVLHLNQDGSDSDLCKIKSPEKMELISFHINRHEIDAWNHLRMRGLDMLIWSGELSNGQQTRQFSLHSCKLLCPRWSL